MGLSRKVKGLSEVNDFSKGCLPVLSSFRGKDLLEGCTLWELNLVDAFLDLELRLSEILPAELKKLTMPLILIVLTCRRIHHQSVESHLRQGKTLAGWGSVGNICSLFHRHLCASEPHLRRT